MMISQNIRTGCRLFLICFISHLSFPAYAADLDQVRPEAVGMSSERLKQIKPFMKQYIDDNKMAGITTLIARKGKIVHYETMGKLDLNTGAKLKPDSLFRIYSMTKPVVTVAAMMLHEEGRFHLNEPVANYIPSFKNTKVLVNGQEVEQTHPFTIRELMSHTAGFTYGFGKSTLDKAYKEVGVLQSKNLEEMVGKLGKLPLMYQPGTVWNYSVSVDVLGRLIEVVSGMPLDEFLKQRIFGPLNMKDTAFYVPDNKKTRFGTNHFRNKEGKLAVFNEPGPSDYTEEVTFFSGGGGLVSTAMDYLKFAQMMLNGGELNGVRLLSPKTIEIMTADHLTNGISHGKLGNKSGESDFISFGLGLGVLTKEPNNVLGSIGTYDWAGAATTIFWNDPKEDLVAILMSQMMRSPYPIRYQFKNLVYQALIQKEN